MKKYERENKIKIKIGDKFVNNPILNGQTTLDMNELCKNKSSNSSKITFYYNNKILDLSKKHYFGSNKTDLLKNIDMEMDQYQAKKLCQDYNNNGGGYLFKIPMIATLVKVPENLFLTGFDISETEYVYFVNYGEGIPRLVRNNNTE